MARGYRQPKKVKEPAVPVVYELSPEVAAIQSRLVRFNPVQFGWSQNFSIGSVMVRGGKPKDEGGCVILARFVKTPPLWHGLTGYDAIIRVEDWAWNRLDSTGQEALVAHELCHGSMSDKGALRVMKHDLDEFGFVVRKYGAWREAIALFDRQLAMFEPGLGTGPTEGEQRSVDEIAADVAKLPPDQQAVVHGAVAALAEPTPIRRKANGADQPPAPR